MCCRRKQHVLQAETACVAGGNSMCCSRRCERADGSSGCRAVAPRRMLYAVCRSAAGLHVVRSAAQLVGFWHCRAKTE